MACSAVFGPDDASSGLRLRGLLIRGRHYRLSIRAVENQYEVEYEFGPHDLVQLAKMINETREPPSPWSDALLARTVGNWFDWRIGDPTDDTRELRASGSNKPEKGKLPLSAPIDFVGIMRGLSGSGSFMPYYVTLLAGAARDRVSFMSSFRHAPQNYVAQIAHWQSQDTPEIDCLRQDLAELGLGFGTSQLLPILVAINQLSPGASSLLTSRKSTSTQRHRLGWRAILFGWPRSAALPSSSRLTANT